MYENHRKTGQVTWQYGACALHARYLMLQTHTQLCNNHCFPTTKWLPDPHLNDTLHVHWLYFYKVNLFCTSLWRRLHVALLWVLPMFSWQFHSRLPVPSLWDFRFCCTFSGMTHCRRHSAVDYNHSTRFHIALSRVEGLAGYEVCAQVVEYIIDSIYWNTYFIVSRHQYGLTMFPAFSPLTLTRPRLSHTERHRKTNCRRPSRHSPKTPSSLEKPLSRFPGRDRECMH
jgi:hypothetical protein